MLFKNYIYVCQCIIFCTQCIFENAKAMIGVNVRKANINEFPFVVSIMRTNLWNPVSEMNHICTGSLISLRDILTFEYCLENERNGIHIVAESVDLRVGVKYYIFWWITYNEWTRKQKTFVEYQENDIAITRLQKSVSNQITPGIISSASSADFVGLDVVMVGWGVSNNGLIPNTMEAVNVTVETTTQCINKIEQIIKRNVVFNSRLLCTFANPYGLIQTGDRGGPLIYRGTIIAVNRSVSPITIGNDYSKKVNLHLSIEYYRAFITDVKTTYR